MELRKNNNSLGDGYLLHWYEIKKVIGRGGFGITYLAHDTNLDRDVAIKEFMPEDFAVRESDSTVHPKTGDQEKLYSWGLDRFIAEARTLAKFNHPNIVRVLSVFEDNNTAYMVMEYAQGRDLSKIYKKEPRFSEDQLLDTFIPILDGLSLVHNAGFIHRDIKPANIYICNNNSPLLLDFGSARQSIGGKTKALTSLVTIGYAPYEQYNEGAGKQGPWTDIYSLGASIYAGITGKKPIDALFRGGSFLEKGLDTYEPVSVLAEGEYSENFLLAVDKALMFKIDERPKNVLRWADMLLGKTEAPQLPDYMLNPPEPDEVTELLWTDTELGYNTGISRSANSGTQGLVDAHGKRAISATAHGENAYGENAQGETAQGETAQGATAQGATDTIIKVRNHSSNENSAQTGGSHHLDDRNLNDSSHDQSQYGSQDRSQNRSQNSDLKNSGLSGIKSNKLWLPIALVGSAVIFLIFLLSWIFTDPSTSEDVVTTQQIQNEGKATQKLKVLQDLKVKQEKSRLKYLLDKAEQSYVVQNYVKPENNNAYYFYQQVLKLETDNKAAKNGIENIQSQLLMLASSAYENEQYKDSKNYLEQLELINSESLDARNLQYQIDEKQTENKQVVAWLSDAKNHIKNNRYTSPENKNAFSVYNKILKQQPANQQALDGLKNIQQHYSALFNKHIARSQLKRAERDIDVMKKISAPSSSIRAMQKTLKNSQQKIQKKIKNKPRNEPRNEQVAKTTAKPKKQTTKKLNIQQVSQLIGQFKSALQARNSKKIKQMSQFVPGRSKFVDQLHSQYRGINVKVSNLQLIAKEKRALANIELTDLVDINGTKISPGNWSKFEIILRYNKKNQLKVYW